MKYLTTIITLIALNIFAVINLLYFGDISREIEKKNKKLIVRISEFQEQLEVNEVEFNLYNNYSYLKQLQNIYFDFEITNSPGHNRISLKDFQNRELTNVYKVQLN